MPKLNNLVYTVATGTGTIKSPTVCTCAYSNLHNPACPAPSANSFVMALAYATQYKAGDTLVYVHASDAGIGIWLQTIDNPTLDNNLVLCSSAHSAWVYHTFELSNRFKDLPVTISWDRGAVRISSTQDPDWRINNLTKGGAVVVDQNP